LSNIYLVRHGQAGPRDAYDSLSVLGRQQARLLGEYWSSQSIAFAAVYSGEMSRQCQTAEEAKAGYGARFPAITADCGWNEFDLARIYREIAPQLCAADPQFQQQYEAMQQQAQATKADDETSAHRRWLPCDTTVVNAWIAGAYEFTGESWPQFYARIAACLQKINGWQEQDSIAVFTSATPIAILTALALEVPSTKLMSLAGVSLNTSVTTLQLRNGTLRLLSFNGTPHLQSSALRTLR